MQYTQKSFTLPASGNQTSQINWDRAFLSPVDFFAKYGADMSAEEREAQRQSFAFGNTSIGNPSITRELIVAAAQNLND
jgi:hypothetical protein